MGEPILQSLTYGGHSSVAPVKGMEINKEEMVAELDFSEETETLRKSEQSTTNNDSPPGRNKEMCMKVDLSPSQRTRLFSLAKKNPVFFWI